MAQILSNGINLEVEEYGDRSNPTLLFICGWSVQLTYWPKDLIDDIVQAGFHVVVFDNRDSGLSHKTPRFPPSSPVSPHVLMSRVLRRKILTSYTLEDLADDAIGVLDALNIRKAHILGLSMGGMIAQIAAAKHPKRVSSLTVLMSTTNRFRLPHANRALALDVFFGRPPRKREARIDRAVRLWNKIGTPNGGYDPKLLRKGLTATIDRCYTPHGRSRQLQAIFATGDIRRWSRMINAPTLVVHGSIDPLLPPHNGVDIAANVRGSRFELIDGLAHDLPPIKLDLIKGLIIEHMKKTAKKPLKLVRA